MPLEQELPRLRFLSATFPTMPDERARTQSWAFVHFSVRRPFELFVPMARSEDSKEIELLGSCRGFRDPGRHPGAKTLRPGAPDKTLAIEVVDQMPSYAAAL